jgi:hypothetical protein
VFAFDMVSMVVKDFDEMINSVVAGLSDGRDEKHLQAARSRRAQVGQRLGRHERTKVRTADADIDDGVHRHAGVSAPLAGVDARYDLLHAIQRLVNAVHDVFAVQREAAVPRQAQRGVQGGAVFRAVDRVAAEQPLDPAAEVAFARQRAQQLGGFLRQPLLGVVEQQVRMAQAEMLEAVVVDGEKLGKMQVAGVDRVRAQLLPDFFIGQDHGLEFLLPQPRGELGADFGMLEAVLDIGYQVAELAAAVIGAALHAVGLHRHLGNQRVDRVGELDFAAGAGIGLF